MMPSSAVPAAHRFKHPPIRRLRLALRPRRFRGLAPTSNPSPVPGPVPTPSSAPTSFGGSSLANLASGNAALFRIIKLVAGAIMLVSFFLPLYGIAGIVSISAMQMTFGITVMGLHLDGEFMNILFLVPGILCLVGVLVLKEKQGNILNIIGGIGALVLVFVISGQANAEMGGYVSVSFELGGGSTSSLTSLASPSACST